MYWVIAGIPHTCEIPLERVKPCLLILNLAIIIKSFSLINTLCLHLVMNIALKIYISLSLYLFTANKPPALDQFHEACSLRNVRIGDVFMYSNHKEFFIKIKCICLYKKFYLMELNENYHKDTPLILQTFIHRTFLETVL